MEKKPTSEDLDDRTLSQLPRLAEQAPQFTETQHDVSSHTSPTVSLRRSQRINKGIPPRRLCYQAEIQRKMERSCWDEMERLPVAEKRKWITAAKEEMNSLRNHLVWELVDLPLGKKTVSAKWVFKAKLDSQGRICAYKARLVARGFSQKYGRDYDETYAPVVKHETVRALLAIAATSKLHVRHLDLKNAYLNGDLQEELCMEQPRVSWKKEKNTRCCLKQLARCWNRKASGTLANPGYTQSQADQCLFIKRAR
uniref:Reverse transcriptase Ty1/copia-type domain-containing protein n=1 Tax=Trichuris muris TaxID=70415 RepID=A0A5S6QKK1_TRIMR